MGDLWVVVDLIVVAAVAAVGVASLMFGTTTCPTTTNFTQPSP